MIKYPKLNVMAFCIATTYKVTRIERTSSFFPLFLIALCLNVLIHTVLRPWPQLALAAAIVNLDYGQRTMDQVHYYCLV